jgi:Tol biopolymer transport system component
LRGNRANGHLPSGAAFGVLLTSSHTMATTIETLKSALAGRYTIEREIGAGGMATVYLAHDVRHKRNVAVKVLNAELGAVLGVERFLAEIQVTANLQHPNLLPLFDSGEAGGLLFYVMPYVEGESLRARLRREKQLPVEEAIRIATLIAGALDYAHRHKVIHRDLKPENVLMHEGQPLIADFGIALAVSNAGGERVTQTGISLGTPHYMSPEQATGDRVVDGRTDIYSLGAMTYEMLVGDPPHNASTSQSIIAKVLTEKPSSIRVSRPNVPGQIDATVLRALEKLAADRFGTAAEFAEALRGKGATTISAAFPSAVSRRPLRRIARDLAPWALAGVFATALVFSVLTKAPVPDTQVIRANFDLPAGWRIPDVNVGTTITISSAGDAIAFTGVNATGFRMFARRINEIAAREISTSAGRSLAFSPDARWIAFAEGNEVRKLSVDGGQTFSVGAGLNALPAGLTWSKLDTIYMGSFSGLFAIPAGGGAGVAFPRDTTRTRIGGRWPILLPGEKMLVFVSQNSAADPPRLAFAALGTGKVTETQLSVQAPIGVLDDQLVFITPAGGLSAVRLDKRTNLPIGEPLQLDDGVIVDPSGGAKAALSASGTLVYLRGRAQLQPLLVSPEGKTGTPMIREPGSYANPRLSPDGKRLALTVFGGASGTDIWIYDIGGNTFTRLTADGTSLRPEWTPDGRRLVYISSRGAAAAIWWQPADRSGTAELLYRPEVEPFEALVSPDSKWLVYRSSPGAKFSRDIFIVPMTGEKVVTPLVVSSFSENLMRLSPDGKWMAYQSNESNKYEIYVRPFPMVGAQSAVSDNGGTEPIWGRDGRSLYYRDPAGAIVKVDVTTGERFSIAGRRTVLTGDYLTDASHASYDVTADGRFVMLKRAGAEAQTIVVHNWARELREKTSRRK